MIIYNHKNCIKRCFVKNFNIGFDPRYFYVKTWASMYTKVSIFLIQSDVGVSE